MVYLIVEPEKLKSETEWSRDKVLENPQMLNSYSYTINNPLRYNDPEGEQLYEVSFSPHLGIPTVSINLSYEPSVGAQWSFDWGIGLGLGLDLAVDYDSDGHLDQSTGSGDQFVNSKFTVVPLVGASRTTQADFNPFNPFDFSNNKKTEWSLGFGAEIGWAYTLSRTLDIIYFNENGDDSAITSDDSSKNYINK